MDAIVLAGGRLKGKLARETGQHIKALLTIQGRTLLDRTIRALAQSCSVNRIALVGPPEVKTPGEAAGANVYVAEGRTGIDSLFAGIQALGIKEQVLISTSDLVAVTPADVDDFICRVPTTAGVSCAIFSAEEYRASFPATPNYGFVPLRDGRFTTGCMFVANAATLEGMEPELQAAFRARKLPPLMALRMGGLTALRVLLGYIVGGQVAPSVEELRQKATKMLRCEVVIVRGASPHLALDIDSTKDWQVAQEVEA